MASPRNQIVKPDSDADHAIEGLPTDDQIPGLYFANASRREEVLRKGRAAAQFVAMQEGQALEGRLIGRGPEVAVKDPDGEAKPTPTWEFDMGNRITVRILSNHELDSSLPALVGRKVYVEKGASKSVGARRVNRWLIVDLDERAEA